MVCNLDLVPYLVSNINYGFESAYRLQWYMTHQFHVTHANLFFTCTFNQKMYSILIKNWHVCFKLMGVVQGHVDLLPDMTDSLSNRYTLVIRYPTTFRQIFWTQNGDRCDPFDHFNHISESLKQFNYKHSASLLQFNWYNNFILLWADQAQV